MAKFKVVRTWYVEAGSTADAVKKTRNFTHTHVLVKRLTDKEMEKRYDKRER